VRGACFRDLGLLGGDAPYLPASTGIQGRHPSGAECALDVLAIKGARGEAWLTPLRSRRQDAALHYGSAFSRGMRVGPGPHPLLLVSGTASIAPSGATIYVGDHQGQVVETYLDAAAVLEAGGASLADVAAAIRYHKDPACWQTHQELERAGLLPDLPAIDVFADVCRDDLLFEMEATGVGRA